MSKKKVAELGKFIDEEASKKIVEDSYVDDTLSGGDKATVERMVGKRDAAGKYDGTISQILGLGGFEVKEFIIEGDMTQDDDNLMNNKVFGYGYDSKKAQLKNIFSINLGKKKRKVKLEPDLTLEDLNKLKDKVMTRRLLLGVTNGFGDFMGIIEPFTIRFKLMMKKFFECESPMLWDQPIEGAFKEAWIDLIAEAVKADVVVFPRRARPENSIGRPRVVGFGDGAFPSFGGCVYLVWQLRSKPPYSREQRIQGQNDQGSIDGHVFPEEGELAEHLGGESFALHGHGEGEQVAANAHYSAHLILAKSKVTPLSGYTIPRSELSAGVLTSRMIYRVIKSLQSSDAPPFSGIMLLDSECTISSLETSSSTLKPFFQNRRAEIIDNLERASKFCTMEEVHWVSTDNNIADILTRGEAKLEDIGPGSPWMQGPTFLSCRRELWPVHRDFVRPSLPDEELKNLKSLLRVAAVQVKGKSQVVEMPKVFTIIQDIMSYNNSLESRKRVLARVVNGWRARRTCRTRSRSSTTWEESLRLQPSPEDLRNAEQLILVTGMISTAIAYEEGKLTSLMPARLGKLIVTTGRLGEGALQAILGVSALPILMNNSRAAELFMWRAHTGYSGLFHRSVAQTVARSRTWVWIVRAKDLAKQITTKCMQCRKEKMKLQGQQMALLKEQVLVQCPPWTYVSLDYAGPVQIRGEVNTRSRGKGWILVFVCQNTKAVCMLPTSGYDTASFLVKYEEFRARKGDQKKITTDRGTQLVKSSIVLAAQDSSPRKWDWKEVVRRNSTVLWEFVPVGSQHRNGLAEATVKILKRCLRLALAPGVVLSYSELITLLAKISNSINSRPLGVKNVSADSLQEDFLVPITPNHLLIGRSDGAVPPLDYDDNSSCTTRLAYVTELYNSWWEAWIQQVLPTLMPIRKWKRRCKNLCIGDVVMLYYEGNLKDDYRLARVMQVHPDKSGLVRTVTIGYRRRNKNEKAEVYMKKPLVLEQVSVQRLCLLVPKDEQF